MPVPAFAGRDPEKAAGMTKFELFRASLKIKTGVIFLASRSGGKPASE
jgi:hypothetical protein